MRHPLSVALAFAILSGAIADARAGQRGPVPDSGTPAQPSSLPIVIRPATLAGIIEEVAGQHVRIRYARVVGVFNPRVFLIDNASRLPPLPDNRGRVLVFTAKGELGVTPTTLVASTVTVVGTARTLLGMQVTREIPWPTELGDEKIRQLDIRAAVLASSVQTAEGVELTRVPADEKR